MAALNQRKPSWTRLVHSQLLQSSASALSFKKPKFFFLVMALCVLPAQSPFASDTALVDSAHALAAMSLELAEAKRQSSPHNRVALAASRLEREVNLLIDGLTRRRNVSAINARVGKVSTRYTELEKAYWRDKSQSGELDVSVQLVRVAKLYISLGKAFYESRYYSSAPDLVIFAAPSLENDGVTLAPVLTIKP
ncbi:MAG: hypothetical protein AB8B95_10325 [Pseudohongiellaceae bacterium]